MFALYDCIMQLHCLEWQVTCQLLLFFPLCGCNLWSWWEHHNSQRSPQLECPALCLPHLQPKPRLLTTNTECELTAAAHIVWFAYMPFDSCKVGPHLDLKEFHTSAAHSLPKHPWHANSQQTSNLLTKVYEVVYQAYRLGNAEQLITDPMYSAEPLSLTSMQYKRNKESPKKSPKTR